jgi:hypothetical protein
VKWDKVLGHFPAGGEPPLYSELASEVRYREKREDQPVQRARLLSELQQASAETRRDMVLRFLQEHLRKVLGIESFDRLELDRPLAEMGLDSLMGIELKSRVGAGLGFDIPLQRFVGANSLAQLASLVLEQSTLSGMVMAAAGGAAEGMEEIAL